MLNIFLAKKGSGLIRNNEQCLEKICAPYYPTVLYFVVQYFVRFCNDFRWKNRIFFHIFKIVIINKLLITSTDVNHLDTSLRHFLISWRFRFVRTAPLFRPWNPLPNSSLIKTNHSNNNPKNNFVRIPTCYEFCTEKFKKFLFIFPCISESWILSHDYKRSYCYLYFF